MTSPTPAKPTAKAKRPKPTRPKVDPRVRLFVAGFLSYARNASHRCNISPWVILAQWGVETGWGSSDLAGHHNLGGIRQYHRPGQQVIEGSGFAGYRTVREFVDDYVYVMNLGYYRAVRALWQPVDSPNAVILPQCRALGASPYDAGHYKGGTTTIGHSLVAAWHKLEPIAAELHAKGPNA